MTDHDIFRHDPDDVLPVPQPGDDLAECLLQAVSYPHWLALRNDTIVAPPAVRTVLNAMHGAINAGNVTTSTKTAYLASACAACSDVAAAQWQAMMSPHDGYPADWYRHVLAIVEPERRMFHATRLGFRPGIVLRWVDVAGVMYSRATVTDIAKGWIAALCVKQGSPQRYRVCLGHALRLKGHIPAIQACRTA